LSGKASGHEKTRDKETAEMKALKALAKRRTLFAIVAALTIFGAVYGFAATLNVGTQTLSAGNATVASCQTTGTPTGTYTVAYDSTIPGYKVTGVTVTGMDPLCNGKTVAVTLTGASAANLASGTATYSSAGSNTSVVISSLSSSPAASLVTGVSVAVNG
jgi:hypothetical protein